MSDSGSGTGTPVSSTITGLTTAAAAGPCVSYARSLELLHLDNKAGAYGYLDTEHCDIAWKVFQREGWVGSLKQAQAEIERDIGAPLCPKQICGEVHAVEREIRLKQAPVAYLGEKSYGDWTEASLTEDGDFYYVEICEDDLDEGVESDDLQFSYPDDVLATYNGEQVLQAPAVSTVSNCNGTGEDGYRFTWPVYQLVKPDEEEVMTTEEDKLLDAVKWRSFTIDSDAAYEVVGYCGCTSCQNEDPSYTLTLCDEERGVVCVKEAGATKCLAGGRHIRLSYGVSFDCGGEIAPDLERAVVLLALVKAQHSPSKPCGCDNTFIDKWLEDGKFSPNDTAVSMRYGITEAGMEVMRILDKYIKRPHFNSEVTTGGLLSARRRKKRNRYGL